MLVDPAYDVDALLGLLAADDMTCVGVLATHYHADHVGGSLFGARLEGIAALLERLDVPIHVQADRGAVDRAHDGRRRRARAPRPGRHGRGRRPSRSSCCTPRGTRPGSQCLLVERHLVTGDTLFLDGCGRTDLPGL